MRSRKMTGRLGNTGIGFLCTYLESAESTGDLQRKLLHGKRAAQSTPGAALQSAQVSGPTSRWPMWQCSLRGSSALAKIDGEDANSSILL